MNKRAVGIEEQLRIVKRAAVTLIDPDGYDDADLFAGFADSVRGPRRDNDGLFDKLTVLGAHRVGRLHERKVGVVGDHRLGEGGVLHATCAELVDLLHHLGHGAFPAVEDGTDLHRCSFDDHGSVPPDRLEPVPASAGICHHMIAQKGLQGKKDLHGAQLDLRTPLIGGICQCFLGGRCRCATRRRAGA